MSAPTRRFTVDTVANAPQAERLVFTAHGRRTGHGSVVWLWAPEFAMAPLPAWRTVEDPPVVALLDTEVYKHRWLDDSGSASPFHLVPDDYAGRAAPSDDPEMDFGSWFGHGTFVAGLVRQYAPGAQLLSLPVMDKYGQVDEDQVVEALRWLADFQDREHRRLVVLMAFGGEAETADPESDETLGKLKAALKVLAGLGVPMVASAGNEGSERPRWPAAFATDPELSKWLVSVGARRTETERAPFSNYGVWVREWREATNVVSLMPLARNPDPDRDQASDIDTNNYAWWSGTSFAAARYASEWACRLMPEEPLDDPVTAA